MNKYYTKAFLSLASIFAATVALCDDTVAETVLERIRKPYEAVTNIQCEVRRTLPISETETLRMLTRVCFERPNKFNSETVSPFKRRIVSDGTKFRSYVDGAAEGFECPVAMLDSAAKAQISMIPGTMDDALRLLQAVKEEALDGDVEFPVRVGYNLEKTFVVLSVDSFGRLARIDVYTDRTCTKSESKTEFLEFKEILPGVWLSCLQSATMHLADGTVVETTRIGNIRVNRKLQSDMFDIEAHFKKGTKFDSKPPRKPPTAHSDAWMQRLHPALFNTQVAKLRAEAMQPKRDDAPYSIFAPARWGIAFYRAQISPAIGARCHLEPSCSEYFLQALRRDGVMAFPLTADRMFREPNVLAAKEHPIVMSNGMIRYEDPVSAHDFWMAGVR